MIADRVSETGFGQASRGISRGLIQCSLCVSGFIVDFWYIPALLSSLTLDALNHFFASLRLGQEANK
jgi:hypothetical protein